MNGRKGRHVLSREKKETDLCREPRVEIGLNPVLEEGE